MIKNIQDFANYFGATTPTELQCALWKLDRYTSSATFTTASGEVFNSYPDFFIQEQQFPQEVVSVVFNAYQEGTEYEPTMTPLVFPFEDCEIDEALIYLDEQIELQD